MSTWAILLAAGSGKRMQGVHADKVLAPLAGEPVLQWSARAFVESELIDGFVVTVRDTNQEMAVTRVLESSGLDLGVVRFVQGGAERCHSVVGALEELPAHVRHVMIHDGARPLVTPSAIRALHEQMLESGAAVLAHPVTDSLKRTHPDGPPEAYANVDRTGLWAMETPQAFARELVLDAYRTALAEGETPTDDAAPLIEQGYPVPLVANDSPNPKLTVPGDFAWAEFLLSRRP